MQRPEPSEGYGFPEEPHVAYDPLGDFEVFVGLIKHQAPRLLGITLLPGTDMEKFHDAVERALRVEGFDFVFGRKDKPGEVLMPGGARLHSEEEMHKPGEIGKILANGEFVATLRKELEALGVLSATTPVSGAFEVIDGASEEPSMKTVEKPAA